MEKTDALNFPLYHSSLVDKGDENYAQNVSDWKEALKEYEQGLEWTASQGTDHYEERHKKRGLLLGFSFSFVHMSNEARDRVRLLLDPDTPFLELGSFAGYKLDTSSPSASIITGIGIIWCRPTTSIETNNSGVKCMIIAHIPTLSGAAWNEFTLIKQNRMTEIATQNRLPLISLVQSVPLFLI